MRALRSFTVRPALPPPLAPLVRLAMNLRWSWDERVRDLFRWVDPDAWERTGHDPVRLLGTADPERPEALARDPAFCGLLDALHTDLEHYLATPGWFQAWKAETGSPLRAVAYFSPEFGIAEALPQYSGGLGVLAGDHLKAASALGVPVVGVGLFYRQGYFHQLLDAEGWQRERYVDLDPYAMALTLVEGARVTVELAGTPLTAQVWRADIGRVRLYLLDSDVDENSEELRRVTDRLYGGDTEHRLRQEILLGIGGVRALDAVGEPTQVFHTNEGHAGFLGLECIRRAMVDDGLSFAEAIEAVRAATIFTTHTPVPAGIDRFPRPLMEKYFTGWCDDVGVAFEDLMALGRAPGEPDDAPFNMAVMGLRLAGRANGVSRLHGTVSRRMFADLWPGVPVEEVPITSVTNGVHPPTWVSAEMTDLLDRYVLPEWQDAGPDRWARISEAREDEIWLVREQCRQRLVTFVRERLRTTEGARGSADTAWVDTVLDPRALTIGFARRFAAYKRATLLLSQPDRLRRLLLDPERPVQIVFAGKAHPADDAGKEMIRQIVQFARQPDVRHRVVFLEDYDIGVARMLYQGCDLWLNNPRRPLEACGTSGQKAALNGALNCSVLDGWWDEMFDGENGWAVPSVEHHHDLTRRDEIEARRACPGAGRVASVTPS
jgi:starch phosphorylase